MTLYREATNSRATFPRLGGALIPPAHTPRTLELPIPSLTALGADAMLSEPPRATDGRTPYSADVIRPLPALGQSVIGTAKQLAPIPPVGQIVNLVRDLPNAPKRPFLPAGLFARVRTIAREAVEPTYGNGSAIRQMIGRTVGNLGRR